MSATVLLFTDQPAFEESWLPAFRSVGAEAQVLKPEALPQSVTEKATLVLDASAALYDEDELLAHVGLAKAMGAIVAVVLPEDGSMGSVDDVLTDLCGGLVSRSAADTGRVASAIARRLEVARKNRFEYLTVSPKGNGLLAILADGSATVLSRPARPEDDGGVVASIELSEDASSAMIELASGVRFRLDAAGVASIALLGPRSTEGTDHIDGARLGQRIRKLRLAAGLTQAELARRTGIHRPNIARVEAGRHTPSLETLARLASAIGVPTTRIFEIN